MQLTIFVAQQTNMFAKKEWPLVTTKSSGTATTPMAIRFQVGFIYTDFRLVIIEEYKK